MSRLSTGVAVQWQHPTFQGHAVRRAFHSGKLALPSFIKTQDLLAALAHLSLRDRCFRRHIVIVKYSERSCLQLHLKVSKTYCRHRSMADGHQ